MIQSRKQPSPLAGHVTATGKKASTKASRRITRRGRAASADSVVRAGREP